ncbi:MAG: DUF565 domain-containing protein [Oscillatoriales cyanobacterium SM2_2_1]|nr:DUF565 domain-containing protein [Oscillatoriales cyanobacterium SM2_2_1]
MQNTRLNTLVEQSGRSLSTWLNNPWRRFSLIALSWLLGFFLGSAVSTTTGATAVWDISSAVFSLVAVEVISRFCYRRNVATITPYAKQFLGLDMLNSLKQGYIYSMFLDAFKLGS